MGYSSTKNSFLDTTPDFLVSCDSCGNGCGEVKCPIVISDGNFDDCVQRKSSCLEKVNRKKPQLLISSTTTPFLSSRLQYDDFVVCAIDNAKNIHFLVQRIYPDVSHWNFVLPKLETF